MRCHGFDLPLKNEAHACSVVPLGQSEAFVITVFAMGKKSETNKLPARPPSAQTTLLKPGDCAERVWRVLKELLVYACCV